MSDEHQEQVPGVTFWFKNSAIMKPIGEEEKFRIDLHLECNVVDEGLWAQIEQKFKEGFRVFTQEDFHLEVMSVMRAKLKMLELQALTAERSLAQERDRREQAEKALEKYESTLNTFGRALRGQ